MDRADSLDAAARAASGEVMSWQDTQDGRRGIWCHRHPDEQLIIIDCPNGKIDLRCDACTKARIARIAAVPTASGPLTGPRDGG
jgi:hypothetical protein